MPVDRHLLPPPISKTGGVLRFANRAGVELDLKLASTSSDERRSHPSDDRDEKTSTALPLDEKIISAQLEGRCAVLPVQWWNYEWCHRREVRQFHLEEIKPSQPKGERDRSTHVMLKREPDFSLGLYKRSIVERRDGNQVGLFCISLLPYPPHRFLLISPLYIRYFFTIDALFASDDG